ncbi:hypothetical protein SISSUDRAFT_1100588 [Sistotremastrum suecicum HHB10207 ss-3]|uniref:F-box domain-containing protein n=1 Tax=Sistotremastrum suecicum HHB10207 ss-3 TaxID=1314776 RepID=A0A165WXR3_9AGAM|nr:hypothetical protein SISSUDRAFT_1100588 [Sistotremastrum suecicum HHB10207 ss-3]
MSFDALPLEMQHKIIRNVQIDTIHPDVSKRDRLKRTLALTHVYAFLPNALYSSHQHTSNRAFRRAALSYHSLWSTIYLEWPAGAVQHFLEQAQRRTHPDITVFLDPKSTGTKDKQKNQKRWAEFLEREMAIIRDLRIKIYRYHHSPELSKALSDTPAPRLATFTLDLDQHQAQNANIRQLFNNHAPNLWSTRLHACAPFDGLSDFPSLAELMYRVTEHNFAELLGMLGRMPKLTYLSLKGADRWSVSPLPTHDPPLETIVLPLCTSLFIWFMNARRTQYILSKIDFPAVAHLDVRETIVEHNNGLLATIFDTLPKLPTIPGSDPRDRIFLGVCSDRLIIQFTGYRFQTEWTNFRFATVVNAVAAFQILFSVITDIICAPANILFLQPPTLHIENSITLDQGVDLSMGLADLSLLLSPIFETYSSVQALTLSGNTAPITQALHDRYPHLLPNLALLRIEPSPRGNLLETYDDLSIIRLQHTRHLGIENDMV